MTGNLNPSVASTLAIPQLIRTRNAHSLEREALLHEFFSLKTKVPRKGTFVFVKRKPRDSRVVGKRLTGEKKSSNVL